MGKVTEEEVRYIAAHIAAEKVMDAFKSLGLSYLKYSNDTVGEIKHTYLPVEVQLTKQAIQSFAQLETKVDALMEYLGLEYRAEVEHTVKGVIKKKGEV